MPQRLGSILLVANPVARNGAGLRAAERAHELLCARFGQDAVSVALTQRSRHAVDIAAGAQAFDTVVALGGDGLIHEVAGGLMRIEGERRPALGLIPVGSGNDYAASLGVSSKLPRAVEQLSAARERLADVGLVNGEPFLETVSFGLDAAIAIDTMERRKKTGRTGTMLYFSAGIDQMLHHLDERPYRMTLDGGRTFAGSMYLLAVQNGRTYGGGFKVCPQAYLDDGIFDVCIAHPPLNALSATVLFALAKEGLHKGAKQIEFARASSVLLEFDEPLPAQVDGELLEGTRFEISVMPRALRVLAPSGHSFKSEDEAGYVRVVE